MPDTEKTVHVDLPSYVTEAQASFLLLYHLQMATSYFEATPVIAELLEAFDNEYPDETALGVRAQRNFIEQLNAEYETEEAVNKNVDAREE